MCGSNCCIKHWLELRNDPIGTQLMHAHQLVGLSTCTDKDTSSTSLLLPEGHRARASCYRDQRNVTDDTVGRERERGKTLQGPLVHGGGWWRDGGMIPMMEGIEWWIGLVDFSFAGEFRCVPDRGRRRRRRGFALLTRSGRCGGWFWQRL